MKDQLAAVGIAVSLENVPDIAAVVASSDFDATMHQYGVAVYGTLVRPLTTFFTPSGTNTDRYTNDEVNQLFAEYSGTIDPAQQEALLTQIQAVIRADVPVVYVLNPNQIVASSTRVTGYAPHPLEIYQITPDLAIE